MSGRFDLSLKPTWPLAKRRFVGGASATPVEGGGGGEIPTPPEGFDLLKGADDAYLLGADSAYLYGETP